MPTKKKKENSTDLYPRRAFHEAQLIGIGPKTVEGTALPRQQRHPEIALIDAAKRKRVSPLRSNACDQRAGSPARTWWDPSWR